MALRAWEYSVPLTATSHDLYPAGQRGSCLVVRHMQKYDAAEDFRRSKKHAT